MAEVIELKAHSRTAHGKAECRRMRRAGESLPAVVYGAGEAPQSIELGQKELRMALENEATYASILDLNIDGKTQKVVLKDLQRHPFRPVLLHADFLRINAKEKLTMSVPLHYLNEETAVGVKTGGGAISRLMNEVEVKCLPGDLPEYIEVDVQDLEMEHSKHLSDIKLPKGVEFAHAIDGEHDQPIISIHKPREAKAEDEDTAAPVAPANPGDDDKAEGDAK